MKKTPVIVFFVVLLALIVFISYYKNYAVYTLHRFIGRKTVAQRLKEFSTAVHKRLVPFFDVAGIPYPPGRVIMVGYKNEKKLEIWASGEEQKYRLIKKYPIIAASGRIGPKLTEGDCQVPEGLYIIESLNPNSRYHLSMRLNYPNEFDRKNADLEARTNLGGDIFIHGSNASIECLAMGDRAAEDLFVLAAETGIENIEVILTPVDFRKVSLPEDVQDLAQWTQILYDHIKQKLSQLNTE